MKSQCVVQQSCKKLLLIQTGTPPQMIKEDQGDLPVWFTRLFKQWENDLLVVKVFLGEELPKPNIDTVAVITGSWDMVTDKLDWSEKTSEWIRRAMKIGMPLFGVCYGHQLMAYALGGSVDYNPAGREIGCKKIVLSTQAHNDSLLTDFPDYFYAYLTHMQTVISLPEGAESLAKSDQDKNQIIRYAPYAYSTQYHPEFTADICTSVIKSRYDALITEGKEPEKMIKEFKDTSLASNVIKNFIQRYLTPNPTQDN